MLQSSESISADAGEKPQWAVLPLVENEEGKMKKVLATIAAVGCLSVAGVAFAGIEAGTGVNGSLHDMTLVVGQSADAMGRVCVFCHTPHHAKVQVNSDQLPLWNHTMTAD